MLVQFAGRVELPADRIEALRHRAAFLGIVPRSRMTELFAWADLFVLPFFCESSATVAYGAISSGVPVICTVHSGALDAAAVTIVSSGDIEALSESLGGFARNGTPTLTGPETLWQYSLDAYAERLLAAVHELDGAYRAIAAG